MNLEEKGFYIEFQNFFTYYHLVSGAISWNWFSVNSELNYKSRSLLFMNI